MHVVFCAYVKNQNPIKTQVGLRLCTNPNTITTTIVCTASETASKDFVFSIFLVLIYKCSLQVQVKVLWPNLPQEMNYAELDTKYILLNLTMLENSIKVAKVVPIALSLAWAIITILRTTESVGPFGLTCKLSV